MLQTHRFPPCYETSRLLEAEARAPGSPTRAGDASLQVNTIAHFLFSNQVPITVEWWQFGRLL